VSYKTEKNKIVLFLSSLHAVGEIKEENKPKVLYYNKIKGANETFNQLCHKYTVLLEEHEDSRFKFFIAC